MSLAVKITERDFQRQVTDMAEILGWSWAHFRPAQTERGWRTPVSGPLGEGWPDLVLVRGESICFAELKRDGAKVSLAQERVHEILGEALHVFVWHPSDWAEIERVLR